MSRLTFILPLLLLFAVPTTTAGPGCDPGEVACVDGGSVGPDADCAEEGNEHVGWTMVSVAPSGNFSATAEGMRYCGEQDGTRWEYNGVEAVVVSPVGDATVSWWSQTRDDGSGAEERCHMSMSVVVLSVSPGCIAGAPPESPWGRIIP